MAPYNILSGYLSPIYAESLAEFGTPRPLPRSQGIVLRRSIQDTSAFDAMGCYPLFSCTNWSALEEDFRDIGRDLVSVVVVTDPFGDYTLPELKSCFPDVTYAFKTHYVVNLSGSLDAHITSHHRRYIKKALEGVQVERCDQPLKHLDIWYGLYQVLIERHHIQGIARFSRDSFAKQMQVPGLVVYRAIYQDKTVGMLLWYIQNDVGYYHLGAYDQMGYTTYSSFALFWTALNDLKQQKLAWLDLGAGAGLTESETDGLAQFKRGWANTTRTAYLCGRIFDQDQYRAIVAKKAVPPTAYFPRYRSSIPL